MAAHNGYVLEAISFFGAKMNWGESVCSFCQGFAKRAPRH